MVIVDDGGGVNDEIQSIYDGYGTYLSRPVVSESNDKLNLGELWCCLMTPVLL